MGIIDIINTFVKMFIISFFTYLTYEKITNYKNKNLNYIIIALVSFIISIAYIMLNKYISPLITIIILYISYGFIVNTIIENSINYLAYIYSCIITYIIYLLAVIMSGVILPIIFQKLEYPPLINLIAIPIIISVLFRYIFKIKRLKNGLGFIRNRDSKKDKSIMIFTMFFTGIILMFFGIYQKQNSNWLVQYLLTGTILTAISLVIWTKKQITKTYKNRMRDRTIEMQKAEIDEQARIMEELKSENLKLASAVHKYNKKFSALEFAMKNVMENGLNTEYANELSVILKETKEASKNFAKEVEITANKLPLTNIVGIDNMFKYMQEEAKKKDINFDLKLNTSINPLLELIITKDKFETLIGDHLKDAIIAVDASPKAYKSILVTLGLVDGNYEFSIYDTGIEFEIDTLLKLGQEQVTTHKDEGGTGIGFMTTFETLKECKGSLVIEEYNPKTTNYTKAVIIRFDGKNEYRICSYRAEKIKEQKHEGRIIIEKLK